MRFIYSFAFTINTVLAVAQTPAESPYNLKTGREVVLLGAGVASYGAAFVFNKKLDAFTPAEVQQLNVLNITPHFDRRATAKYSPSAARLSDVTLIADVALTGGVILASRRPSEGNGFFTSDLYTVGVMYVETMLLTNGIKSTVKDAVERTRPFAYNTAAPLDDKLDKDARRSFYSGHASNAFATAVFAAEVFRHYHPNSKAKPWIWVGSLGLATGTAYLRYEAGQHFPSDLLVGAAMGSLAGWGVPKLHQNRTGSAQSALKNVTAMPWSNGLASGVYLRSSF
ncbi:phosphatase PAP2 family protein [Fibrella sp. HMF5335]|uniref:Phosphatase PAP2 family protein n=1 Tax=Fibrella rubiginis TaxID=2817060 RepID=A0A939GHN7_9BACT|nr:phosphatase PAP2 family protein [Fibrella rubiginis]MBO0938506.1 phosphatase PAP2 family protein [Fibrella rubiginis]